MPVTHIQRLVARHNLKLAGWVVDDVGRECWSQKGFGWGFASIERRTERDPAQLETLQPRSQPLYAAFRVQREAEIDELSVSIGLQVKRAPRLVSKPVGKQFNCTVGSR